MDKERLLTVKETAEYLRLSIPTVKRHLTGGLLKGFKAGRQWRVRMRDIQEYLKKGGR